jgi:hypothetical protein
MNLNVGKTDEWKGVPIWWCKQHRYPVEEAKQESKPPKKRVTHVPDTGKPLGDRPVDPGTMHWNKPRGI